MNDVVFLKGEGGLGRELYGKDFYSSFLFYSDVLPSGFATTDRIKVIQSLPEAEALGITDTHADETIATGGKVTIATVGAAGDVWKAFIDDGLLGSYTVQTGDAVGDIASGLKSAIDLRFSKHGYSTSVTLGAISLTAPAKLGISINGAGHLTCVSSGAGTSTITAFSGGIGSYFAVMHYHISEYFRIQPKGKLWIGIYAVPTTFDGAEIQTIQNFANGEIRKMGVFLSSETFASSQLSAIQTVCNTLETNHKPLSILFSANCSALDLATLPDLATLSNKNVSVVIGEEGNWHKPIYVKTKTYLIGDKAVFNGKVYICKLNTGVEVSPFENSNWTAISENLALICGYSISCLGTTLGTVALAMVHENIGWVGKFNISESNNLDEAGFVTKVLYSGQSEQLLNTLNKKHYIFLRKHIGIDGTYYNDSWTSIVETSDYCTIENNVTMDKATRGIRINILPLLASPLYVNSDGTLSEDTIVLFKNTAKRALELMQRDGEISNFVVTINPAQNILSTSKIIINIKIIPVGVAREIEINIGFTVKLA